MKDEELKATAPPATVTAALSTDEHVRRAKHSSNADSCNKTSTVELNATIFGEISKERAPPLDEEDTDRHDCRATDAKQRENEFDTM
jgi:hypothetical protein